MSASRLTDRNRDLQDRNDTLQVQNKALQSKLDEIHEIVECNDPQCTAEDHLAEIQDIVDGNGNGGNGNDDEDD